MKKKNDSGAADNAKKKSTQDSGEQSKQGKSSSGKTGSGIVKFALPGLGATTLVIIGMGIMLAWLQFGRHQELNEQRLATALVQSQASLLQLSLEQADARLERLAASEQVRQAIADERTGEVEQQLSEIMSGEVVIVPAGTPTSERDLSFTARDLIEQVRDGEDPEPVMIPAQPPHLLNARTTPDGEGVVFLSSSLNQLKGQLENQDLQNAHLRIEQQGGAEILTRGKANNGVTVSAQAPFDIKVTLTLPAASRASSLVTLFVLITVGALILALLLQSFVFRAVAQAIRKDGAVLSNLAQELAQDSNALPRGTFSFQPLQLVTANLQKLAQKAATRKTQQPAARKKPAAAPEPDLQVDGESPDTDTGSSGMGGGQQLPAGIFRAYDVRGRTDGDLTEENVRLIGRAIASEASDRGQKSILVARDGRNSSPALENALVEGLTGSGINVIKLGAVPTPLLYYAVGVLDTPNGVCITGSHNPAEYNGIKVVLEGSSLHGEQIQNLRTRIARDKLTQGEGQVSETDIVNHYISAVQDDIVLARPLHVVADCANGIAGAVVPDLLRALGCDLTELYTEVDGTFPHHGPDPGNPDNLTALIDKVKEAGADLGIAFDGDGDRLVVVTGQGEIIWPDRLMMLYARDLLSRAPGADIIFDVKCSRELSRLISHQGGRPLMWKTGHSLLHAKLQEMGAPLAGEMSGHIFFADRWNGFDDALYAAARLLEILSLESDDVQAIFDQLPTGVSTPEMPITVSDENKFALVDKVVAGASDADEGSVSTLDGLRIDFEDGWGLVRASNTGPTLVARFEGRDQQALERIQKLFHDRLAAVDPALDLPF